MEPPPVRRRQYRLQPHSPSMDSDLYASSFPFVLPPIEIQSRILGLLPITTLVVCRAVSHEWRSIIRSPDFLASYHPSRDPIFLLWSNDHSTLSACAYLPSGDRWINFHFPQSLRTFGSITSSGGSSLILSTYYCRYYIVSPFSAPHPVIDFLPRVDYHYDFYHALAFIHYSPSDYKILLVSTRHDGLSSGIYHSRSGKCEPCLDFPHTFSSLESGVYLDGLIFCLSSLPDHLLTFNPVTEKWTILDLDFPLPSTDFRHLFIFGGELYLTAAVEESMVISKVGIWELDRSAMTWREFGFMPAEYLAEFNVSTDKNFFYEVVDCMGMLCFSSLKLKKIVMCDLAVRRWWCPQPCNIPGDWRFSVHLALEPHIDLLK